MQGEELAKVEGFKYLISTVQSNGECGREVTKRVGHNFIGRIELVEKNVRSALQQASIGKVYNVAVRPAMFYRLETVALTKRQEAEMELAELKMLRFSFGVTRINKTKNESEAQVGRIGEKTREARLRYGITGRSYREEATKPSYDLLTAVRTRRHYLLGHIQRIPAKRLVRRAVLALGQRAGPP